jgi:Cu-Zn family superoxide dismutase
MPSQQDSVTVRAVCVLKGGENNTIQGVINFAQMIGMNQMKITGEIQNLPIDRKLAIHVHEYGDLTNGPVSTGGRFNPEKKVSNSSKDQTYNINEEFGNLQINPEGQAKIDVIDKRLTLFGPSSIIGRSVVIIDEKEEDATRAETEENKGSSTTSTNRVAAGVIGICE